MNKIPDNSIDLLLADPPYCLGKDYGNDSDKMNENDYLEWTFKWIDAFTLFYTSIFANICEPKK